MVFVDGWVMKRRVCGFTACLGGLVCIHGERSRKGLKAGGGREGERRE